MNQNKENKKKRISLVYCLYIYVIHYINLFIFIQYFIVIYILKHLNNLILWSSILGEMNISNTLLKQLNMYSKFYKEIVINIFGEGTGTLWYLIR